MQKEYLQYRGGITQFFIKSFSTCQKAITSCRLLFCFDKPQPDSQSQKWHLLLSNFTTFQMPSSSQFDHLQYKCWLFNQFYTNTCNAVALGSSIKLPCICRFGLSWSNIEKSMLTPQRAQKSTTTMMEGRHITSHHIITFLHPQNKYDIQTFSCITSVH